MFKATGMQMCVSRLMMPAVCCQEKIGVEHGPATKVMSKLHEHSVLKFDVSQVVDI